MRISVHPRGFELRPLSRFRSRIRLVSVNLAIGIREGLCLPANCDVIVSLRPSGEVRVRNEDMHVDVVIAKTSELLRGAVERELSQGRPVPPSPRGTQGPAAEGIAVAADSAMSPRKRKRSDRREYELWQMPAGEYWRSPGLDADEGPEQLREAVHTT
jgi:hypothetical protein